MEWNEGQMEWMEWKGPWTTTWKNKWNMEETEGIKRNSGRKHQTMENDSLLILLQH